MPYIDLHDVYDFVGAMILALGFILVGAIAIFGLIVCVEDHKRCKAARDAAKRRDAEWKRRHRL